MARRAAQHETSGRDGLRAGAVGATGATPAAPGPASNTAAVRPRWRVPGVAIARTGREALAALRSWARRPATALLAAVTLGIGMAAVASVLALADALFLSPVPGIADSDGLVNVEVEH